MNLFRKKKNKTIKPSDILSHPLHEWIRKDRHLYRFFSHILTTLKQDDLLKVTEQRTIVFLKCLGQYSATLPNSDDFNLILIFPNLLEEIYKANNRHAEAIVFHELGHIYHLHFESHKNEVIKQVEADRFACRYGYGDELIEFLKSFNNAESSIRLKEICKLSQ